MNKKLEHLQHTFSRALSVPVLAPAIRFTSVLAAGILLASCANDPAATSQANADQECVYVRVTGSNLPVKECRSAAEREALAARERAESEELFRQTQLLDETGGASLGADSLQ